MLVERVKRRWSGQTCVVAATGPSLTAEAANACRGLPAIAVQDAYLRLPWAEVLYGCDAAWWETHNGVPWFNGERWSSHGAGGNNKLAAADRYGLTLVNGRQAQGFSTDQTHINYGGNSGFQAINLAILFGAATILLIGFDMRGGHFFGNHPKPLRNTNPSRFVQAFTVAAKTVPQDISIVNCTPRSALTCFRMQNLKDALAAALNVTAGDIGHAGRQIAPSHNRPAP